MKSPIGQAALVVVLWLVMALMLGSFIASIVRRRHALTLRHSMLAFGAMAGFLVVSCVAAFLLFVIWTG